MSSKGTDEPTLLVVGDLRRWQLAGRALPSGDGLFFASFIELTREFLEHTMPDLILSPLVAQDFDAVDVARRLINAGYEGRYRAVAERIPQPEVVRREVNAIAPNLDFDIMLFDQ